MVSKTPRSMESGGLGLTRGACFVARGRMIGPLRSPRLAAVVLVVVLSAAGFPCFFFRFVFFERTWPAASIRPPCLLYLSTV